MKKCSFLLLLFPVLTSCSPEFWLGVLAGAASYMDQSYNPYANMSYSYSSYPMMSPVTSQNDYSAAFRNIAEQTIRESEARQEEEYQTFRNYNKKVDGSEYTRAEWQAIQGQALMESEGKSTTSSSGTGYSSSSSSSSLRSCTKVSVTDIAHCNGTGKCSKCNGEGKYYDTSYGISRWVNPCIICDGSGKCPSCHGK